MKRSLSAPVWLAAAVLALGFRVEPARAAGDGLTLDARLVWATNDKKSSDPRHIPVDADLMQKLLDCPYRWTNYFEINRLQINLAEAGNDSVQMSKRCTLGLRNLGGNRVEVKLYGAGKLLLTQSQHVSEDWPLVLAGNADNNTAWLVVLTRIENPEGRVAAAFTCTNSPAGPGTNVYLFGDQSTGPITGRNWSFGDGMSSVVQSPYHIYSNAGVFTVKLTVTGASGQTATASRTLDVSH
jgi:hypothetical protein